MQIAWHDGMGEDGRWQRGWKNKGRGWDVADTKRGMGGGGG